jgi:hypothetical protein
MREINLSVSLRHTNGHSESPGSFFNKINRLEIPRI